MKRITVALVNSRGRT